jgi:aminoglycoside phosphotransferase (APT) family kinase protein
MHGDYQTANVMFGHQPPARLAAIIDWEMATIGDPKLDLAWALQGWTTDTTRLRIWGIEQDLTVDDLLIYYSEHSGRQVDDFDYYMVLARWKLAIVLEQSYQRAHADPSLEFFGPMVLQLMAAAAELAERSGYKGP